MQLVICSKPGGVIRLFPWLTELTEPPCTPVRFSIQEECSRRPRGCGKGLLDEQRLAQLVAAHERLHGPKTAKKVLDFTVLVDPLGGAERRRADDLQSARIGDPIALEA